MDLEGISRYEKLEDLFADRALDLIDVCLPPALHTQVAVAASGAGRHVFCEKPIALTPGDADRMVKAARRRQAPHDRTRFAFLPQYRFAYQTIVSGKYGKVIGGYFKRVISDPLWIPHSTVRAFAVARCSTCTSTTPTSSVSSSGCRRRSTRSDACG